MTKGGQQVTKRQPKNYPGRGERSTKRRYGIRTFTGVGLNTLHYTRIRQRDRERWDRSFRYSGLEMDVGCVCGCLGGLDPCAHDL